MTESNDETMPVPEGYLEVQPEDEEPIEFTHYDCWPDIEDWAHPLNVAFVTELVTGWAKEFGLPHLNELPPRYVEAAVYARLCGPARSPQKTIGTLGQIEFMRALAYEFCKAGYRVYDGDECFEIYSRRT